MLRKHALEYKGTPYSEQKEQFHLPFQPTFKFIHFREWSLSICHGGGGGFLRGACNKNAVLRRGFKQIAKEWRGMKHKLYIFQNFTNNLATQIA